MSLVRLKRKKRKKLLLKALSFVFMQHAGNLGRILRLASAHMKKKTVTTSLGIGWVLLRDVVYFLVYSLFFSLILGGNQTVSGMGRFHYLLTGIVPWFFLNEVLGMGSQAMINNQVIFSSMNFPVTILPTVEVLSILFTRLITFIILFFLLFILGLGGSIHFGLFFYYFFTMVFFSVAFTQFISGLVAISSDFNQLYHMFLRIIFFTVPVMWSFDVLRNASSIFSEWLIFALKLNPLTYILTGFRDAFYSGSLPSLPYTIYFWSLAAVVLLSGCFLQYKLRRYYDDWM